MSDTAPALRPYRATTPVSYNGIRYEPGDCLLLADGGDDATGLLARGAIAADATSDTAPAPTTKKPSRTKRAA